MAFVNEAVPQSDRTRAVFQSGLRWPHLGPPIIPSKWTIDRERDVFLMISSMGGPEEDTVYFILGWKGELVRIALDLKISDKHPDDRYDMTWKLRTLNLPDAVKTERDEVVQALKEALDVHGRFNSRETIATVHCLF